ncbi:ABC transporter substrate-binding protein [Schumannella sp. 10F1B-5-1]|uniref:ABC transporter substrate-binding protein n=1 Tax=Schumannella sp. 10F1B-5-1 TaxID=2590780 RepID=UPI00113212CB|nr:ABC transporter substrate-binding protein [Schumannella sp. 10F1B-5-1]TPW73121.1 hypothetical protein FJ658_07725 [Schumannella sp. 10F1B-5-1]
MISRLRPAVLAAAAVVVALLAGCTGAPQPHLVAGSAVRVGVDQPLTSANARTSPARGNATDSAVAGLIRDGFGWWGDDGEWVADRAFGSVDVVAEQPFTVRWTVSTGVAWSDGVPIDAADLLLAWAADSTRLTTPGLRVDDYVDPDTGRLSDDLPDDAVYFDGARSSGLEHSTATPTVGDDGRSITVVFDRPVTNLPALIAPVVPAHLAAEAALGTRHQRDGADAKAAVIAAIEGADAASLAPLARSWNSDWTVGDEVDARLAISSGPYALETVAADGSAVLRARDDYRGTRQPGVDELDLRVATDPLAAVKSFRDGDLDVVSPEPSADVAALLRDDPDLDPVFGSRGRVEHLELRASGSRSGVFDDPRVRRAFLAVVPRERIVAATAGEVDPDAEPVAASLFRPGASGMAAGSAAADLPDDPDVAAAKRLLRQAGESAPEVCVLFDPDRASRRTAFELLRDAAAKAGFVVQDCSTPDWASQLGSAGAYDAALFAWDTAGLPPEGLAEPFRSTSVANFTGFGDAESDRLLARIQSAAVDGDTAERDRLLAELETRVAQAAVTLPLSASPTIVLTSGAISGVVASPLTGGVLDAAWAWRPTADDGASG